MIRTVIIAAALALASSAQAQEQPAMHRVFDGTWCRVDAGEKNQVSTSTHRRCTSVPDGTHGVVINDKRLSLITPAWAAECSIQSARPTAAGLGYSVAITCTRGN